MKSKITSFVMTVVTLLAIVLLYVVGTMIYDEYIKNDITAEVEEFVSNITIDNSKLVEDVKVPEILQVEVKEEKQNSENMTYSSIEINKHFYNQLDNYAKIIYSALEANKENMKTGTYEINLGAEFSSLLSTQNGSELLGDYYQSAIEAYTYDNPDVFYIDFSKLYLNIETTTRGTKKTYRVSINCGNQQNYLTKEFSSKEDIDNALYQMEKVKSYFMQNRRENIYEDIKIVHDYLVESIEYDQTLSEPNIYNIYGAIVNRRCVCEGYSKSFKYILDSLDIPCVIVAGLGTNPEGNTENHAWNYVELEGNWYAIDCTWDDPILIGSGFIPYSARYKYFLKGEKEFSESHIPNGKFTEDGKQFEYPSLNFYNY